MKNGAGAALVVVAVAVVLMIQAGTMHRIDIPVDDAYVEEELPRAVPPEGRGEEGEGLEAQAAWAWYRLTYPTGQVPQTDWRGNAVSYVNANVPPQVPEGVRTLPVNPRGGPHTPLAPSVTPVTTTWTTVGPSPLDSSGTSAGYKYGIVSGRVNAIAVVPTSPNVAYIGMPVGGVWKTTNCCSTLTTWTPLWESADLKAQSVGAIAIDPNNPDVIYAGTGDSQVPHGDMYGNGIYKSTDGGATWTQYGSSVFSPYTLSGAPASTCCTLAPDENIKVIAVHPNNSNIVIAGASFGLFISWDAGMTWTRYDIVNRNAAPYNDDAQRVSGLLVDGPSNTMYVAVGYPYYSSLRRPGLNAGANGIYAATIPTTPGAPTFAAMNTGLPSGTGSGSNNDVGRIELAWDAAHTRLYALISNFGTSNTNLTGYTLGLYTAPIAGTWTLVANTNDKMQGPNVSTNWKQSCGSGTDEFGQDWYDYYVGVDPNNDKLVYAGRTGTYSLTLNSTYGSATIANLSNVYGTACAGYGTIHPDAHAIAIVPGTNPTRFLTGNDGGIYLGTGAVGGFTQLNGNGGAGSISTNQFYAGQLGGNFANAANQFLFGGMQDNGNASWDNAQSNFQWIARGNGGDGFFTAFDPIAGTRSAGRWYTEYTYGDMDCSTTGAAGSFTACAPAYATTSSSGVDKRDWSTPFLLDQWNCTTTQCNNLFLGTSRVWASVATGRPSWTTTGSADLTKNLNAFSAIIALNVAHSNPGSVIVGTADGNVQWSNNALTGANCTAAAANTASFACTVNGSATWVNLTNSNAVLPNRSINGVAFAPLTNTVVYAAVGGFNINTPGTSGHIFRGVCSASPCTAGNITWTDKTGTLPDVPFNAVQVNPSLPNQVFVGTDLDFFFTNDITASPPKWYRFQTGLAYTRIAYLAVDRGPASSPRASTTVGAYTYGRGLYLAQLGDWPTAITTQNFTAEASADDAWLIVPILLGMIGLTLLGLLPHQRAAQ